MLLPWISISRSSAARLAAAAAALASADRAPAPPADPRPAVVLTMVVSGPQLEPRLGRDCGPLRKALGDSLRAMLDRNFSFLRWQDSAAADTLEARWLQLALSPPNAQVALTIRGRRAGDRAGSDTLDFESWDRLITRPACPDTALREWVPQLDGQMRIRQQRLVEKVFGQVPLSVDSLPARVAFFFQPELAAQVRLSPDAIRASSAPPGFGLLVRVSDPGPPERVGDGVLELTGCLPNEAQDAYTCDLGAFVFQKQSTTAQAKAAMLARSKITPLALYLRSYQPATFATDNGLVAPP
jgi:hypothetical protein